MEKKEPSYTDNGNENMQSQYGEQYGGLFKTKQTKKELLYDPTIPVLGI